MTVQPWIDAPRAAELPEHVDRFERQFQQLKAAIHQQVIESLDLSDRQAAHRERLRRQVREVADHVCRARREALSTLDRERLMEEIMSEVFGLGPLDRLMSDPSVSDILVNDPYTVYVERH